MNFMKKKLDSIEDNQKNIDRNVFLINEKVDKLLTPLLNILSNSHPDLAKSLADDPNLLESLIDKRVSHLQKIEDFIDEDEHKKKLQQVNEQIRKNVAKQAHKDLDKMTEIPQLPFERYGVKAYGYNPLHDTIRFEYKRKGKVTIAKLYKQTDDGNEILTKVAKASCMNGDENITVIGQVIAVCRLFEMEVPEEYLTLPQSEDCYESHHSVWENPTTPNTIQLGMSLEQAEVLLEILRNIRVSDTGEGTAHKNRINSIIYELQNDLERTIYRSGLKEAKGNVQPLPVL